MYRALAPAVALVLVALGSRGVAASGPPSEPNDERPASARPPRVVEFPPLAQPGSSDQRGRVRARIRVGPDGRIIRVVAIELDPGLDESFRSASADYVGALRFQPAVAADGRGTAAEVDLELHFAPGGGWANHDHGADPRTPATPSPWANEDGNEATPPGPSKESSATPAPELDATPEAEAETTPAADGTAAATEAEPAGEDDEAFVRSIDVDEPAIPRPEELAGSDFDIELGHLGHVPHGSAERLLPLAPGVFLSNAGGEGHASGVFLRGFDAKEGQDFEMLVDEIPINDVSNPHNHGYADTSFVIPELITHVRVIEGPFDARQGDFAVAGSAKFDLGVASRGTMVKGSYGSFNTGRALMLWGPEEFGDGTFVAVDYKQSDGFGVNRASRQGRAWGSFEHAFGGGFRLRARTWASASQWDQAGVVRADDVDAGRMSNCGSSEDAQYFCTYDPYQGGANLRVGGSVALHKHGEHGHYEQRLWVLHRNMRIRENFTGFVVDVRPDGAEQRGDLAQQRYRALTYGTRGSYHMERSWRELPQHFEVGFGLRYDDGEGDQRRLRAESAVPYRVDFDNEIGVLDLDVFGSSVLRPHERLSFGVGVRADLFHFAVTDRNLPTEDREGDRLGDASFEAVGFALQPRLTSNVTLARWVGWRDEAAHDDDAPLGWGTLDWVSAYGIGTRSSDATTLSQGEFAPFARVQSAETGLRLRWDGIADRLGFELRSLGFYTHVDRELVFDPEQGRNTLGLVDPETGNRLLQSNRFGLLQSLRFRVDDWLDLMASFTWSEAYLQRETAGAFEWTEGPRLPYIPRFVSRLDAAVFHDFRIKNQSFAWNLGAGASYVAPRPLPLNTFGTRYFVVDLGGSLRWRWIEGGIQIRNLLDARYHEFELNYASNFEGPTARPSRLPALHFAAGAPLTAMGTLTLHFGQIHRRSKDGTKSAAGNALEEET